MNALRRAFIAASCALASACTSLNSYTNNPLDPPVGAQQASRASLAVSAERGNPRVLVMLALSGGGSRAAYFSAAVMLKLQTVFPERDLLREVDVLSSVSGGSMTAAYYAISKDARIEDAALAEAVAPPPPAEPMAPAKLRRQAGSLTCSEPLTPDEVAALRERLAGSDRARDPDYAVRKAADLCRQASVASNRPWDEATVKDLMTRNYVSRWIGNWFWPTNIFNYWFTAFDRSDLMAQTFADNLFDVAVTGRDLTFADLNPERPYLIINSTNATGGYCDGKGLPFGAVFTFTDEDFRGYINSDLSSYSVARAVMASASFPVVFANMTLRDYRVHPSCGDAKRYVHVFDGGNSDNLGLATLKRVLLNAALDGSVAGYDRIVVISIDAFTRPAGTPSSHRDSRGDFFSFFLDTNLNSAIDSLLQANRDNNLDEFREQADPWTECAEMSGDRKRLCDGIRNRLVFYHIGFDNVGEKAMFDELDEDGKPVKVPLTARLDRIPTTLKLSDEDRRALDQAVDAIVRPNNGCLIAIRGIVSGAGPSPAEARSACKDAEPELKPARKKR